MTAPSTEPTPAPAGAQEDNLVAILSYLTLIGFIVAIILHGQKKTALGAYHLRQALGFMIVAIVASVGFMIVSTILAFIPFLGWIAALLLSLALTLGVLALWIIGLLNALNRQMKPLPLIGGYSDQYLANAFPL